MNKIKYILSRSIQMLKEQGLLFFIKILLGKFLGKNVDFINFIFKKGNYYFRGSDIGFYMIKDTYKYMENANFEEKYNNLILGLDNESKINVDLFIKYIKLFYYNNVVHESDLYTEGEKKLYIKSQEFMGKYGVLHPTGYGLFDNEIIKGKLNGAVFDIGSSEGIESIMFAKLIKGNKKIYSFEPSSYNYKKLQENINNSIYKNDIIPQNIALGDKNEIIEIYGNSGVEVSTININNSKSYSEKVKMQKIDYFVKKNNIKKVDLIKWDIEGTEIESIIGGKETIIRDKPILVVSIYHNGKEFFETKPLIESWNLGYNFKIIQSEPGGTWVGFVLICY